MVKGEDIVVPSQAHNIPLSARTRAKGGSGGIDEAAQHTSEHGFSAGGWALYQKDGIGAGGPESRNKPGEGGRWKEERRGQDGAGLGRRRQRLLGAGAAEGAAGCGDYLPSRGSDLDRIALRVAKIDENSNRIGGLAAVRDAQREGLPRKFAAAGLGFEQLEGGAELEK